MAVGINKAGRQYESASIDNAFTFESIEVTDLDDAIAIDTDRAVEWLTTRPVVNDSVCDQCTGDNRHWFTACRKRGNKNSY
jgi:hypothetical protein